MDASPGLERREYRSTPAPITRADTATVFFIDVPVRGTEHPVQKREAI
jgi:hypothetical protein